jgi:hypothetical protein
MFARISQHIAVLSKAEISEITPMLPGLRAQPFEPFKNGL